MLRFLLKFVLLLWLLLVGMLLAGLGIGKIAPESSKIAFFSQDVDGTSYWRVDMFTGIAFSDNYINRIYIPRNRRSPIPHFLSIRSDAFYNYVSEVDLYSREESYVGKYPSRGYVMRLVGDNILTIDNANQWELISIPNGELDRFGNYPNLNNEHSSPDGRWIAGRIYNQNIYFVNLLTGEHYEISGYSDVFWSEDSQWMIARESENAANIAILNALDSSPHPILGQSFPALYARWSEDSQSIFYQDKQQVMQIDLLSGAIQNYPAQAENFWLPCLAPNQRLILARENSRLLLLDLETGRELWRYSRLYGYFPDCIWSEDSRYLLMYLAASELDALGNPRIAWESFVLLDTETGATWEQFPSNLPSSFSYLHIPD